MIYSDVISHETASLPSEKFHKVKSIKIEYSITLTDFEQIKNLLTMTQFGWKISTDQRSGLLVLSRLEIECDFNIDIFSRHS